MRKKAYLGEELGQVDQHQQKLIKLMEEMANAPREPYVRQPGERQAREIYAEKF